MTITKDDVRAMVERASKTEDTDTVQKGARALHQACLANYTKEALVRQLMEYWDNTAKAMDRDELLECITEDTYDMMYAQNKFDLPKMGH